MTEQVFKSAAGEARYLAAYEAALGLWPVRPASRYVSTRWGRTHVLVGGSADAPPLVLLHGMNLSATMWFANAADLSRERCVYAVDTLGAAGRSVPARPLQSRADCAAWLGDVLDGLGLARADVMGHSHGGWLALNFAASVPERVERLVLLAPAGGLRPLAAPFWLRGIPVMLFPTRASIVGYMRWMTGKGYVVPEPFVDQFVLGMQHVRLQIDVLPAVFDDKELGRVRAPALLLIGEREVICDPQAVVARARRWMPQVEAEMVPGAGHGLPMEQPGLVNGRVLRFLGRFCM